MRVETIGLATLYLGDCREVLHDITVTADTAVIPTHRTAAVDFKKPARARGALASGTK